MEPQSKRQRLSEQGAPTPGEQPGGPPAQDLQQQAVQNAADGQQHDSKAGAHQQPDHHPQQQLDQQQEQHPHQQHHQQYHQQHHQQQQQQQQQVQQQQQQQVQLPPPSALGAYTQREEHLQRQEAMGELEFAYVLNDGAPLNMKRLMGLKVIFSKQLPNMPKEYICRLLLDRRHRSVALVSCQTGAVLGGITYRVFGQQGLGEIAFCAVAANQQVRGFGTRLMNHTKAMARDWDGLTHFLTYADNNAVGYFSKQGFTKEITMAREQWVGYIKDYDGGTLMEYVIHPKIPYADLVGMFRVQREYLDTQIRGLSNSHIIHAGITRQRVPLLPAHGRIKEIAVPVKPEEIPGVKEAGWSAGNAFKAGYQLVLANGQVVEATIPHLHTYMGELLTAVEENHNISWPFLKPVDPQLALDYYDVILDPVDLSLMRSRLGCGQYYLSLEMFVADMRKMCDNCRYYNMPSSDYYQIANKLQAFVDQYLANSVVAAPTSTAGEPAA